MTSAPVKPRQPAFNKRRPLRKSTASLSAAAGAGALSCSMRASVRKTPPTAWSRDSAFSRVLLVPYMPAYKETREFLTYWQLLLHPKQVPMAGLYCEIQVLTASRLRARDKETTS